MAALCSVPEISISLAPPEEPVAEPFSPFAATGFNMPTTPDGLDVDTFRPMLLSPPHTTSPRQLSPLRPADSPVRGKGLERARFEALLQASRERNAAMGGKKDTDLRKEIAMKAHKNKQAERRAMFLSKVQAPPSPGATLTPKTPPESPAIFHYSLPSPGMRSPLTAFEDEDPSKLRDPWVEQVEFHMPGQDCAKPVSRPPSVYTTMRLPSLDQITAHLSHQGNNYDASAKPKHSTRLPAFLMTPATKNTDSGKPRHTLPPAVGRLQFPVRPASPPAEEEGLNLHVPSPRLPPSPCSPKLQIKTTVVPRTSSFSPVDLTECNLRALDLARERTAQNMLVRLARRTVLTEVGSQRPVGDEERKLRRHSAPPELVSLERIGFIRPKLNIPGAF